MGHLLHGFARNRRGAVALLGVFCMTALLASAAIGVDLGNLFVKSRELQGVADLAAMASVQALASGSQTTPAAQASATAALDGWPGGISAQAQPGVYTGDPTLPASQRFVAGAANPNAVQVTLSAPVPLYFAGLLIGRSSVTVARAAIAARAQYAAFSIGSGLASLNGGVANALLSALTGSQVQLSLADYQALASAQVDLLAYLPALQSRAALQGLSFNQVLATSVPPSMALGALADVLTSDGQTAAAGAARTLAAASAGLPATALNTLFDLGPYGAQDHASDGDGAGVAVGALGLTDAVLAAANGSRQLSLSLNGALPGVADLSMWLAIGQRTSASPWLTVTDTGQEVVRTAQMRLYLQAGLAPGVLSSATNGAPVTLPVYVEAASAQAELSTLQCPVDPTGQTFSLSVSPSLGVLALAQVDPASLSAFSSPVALKPAILIGAPLLAVTAFSQVDLGGGQTSWQTVSFSQADIAAQTMKSVFTRDVAQASVASLLATTSVSVQAGPSGLSPGGTDVAPAVRGLLTSAAPSLDAVLTQVEAVSGVRLGEADVWGDGLRCRGAALVA
jgi:uncharacterized membrane protein